LLVGQEPGFIGGATRVGPGVFGAMACG